MPNYLSTLKRQIEILALFYTKPDREKYYVSDLAYKYSMSEVSILRDLKDLRAMGIDIHSVQNRGVEISGNISSELLSGLIVKYLALVNSGLILSNAFDQVMQSGMQAVKIISVINNCIEKQTYALFEVDSPMIVERSLKIIPCKLIDNNGRFEVLFIYNNIPQSIEFKSIVSARDLDETNNIDYKNKIKAFIKEYYKKEPASLLIKLQVSSKETRRNFEINNIRFIQNDENGAVLAEVNNATLDDVAIWAMKQSGKVKILEPKMLIDKIREMAEEAIGKSSLREECSEYNSYDSESGDKTDSMLSRDIPMFCRTSHIYSPASKWQMESVKDSANESAKEPVLRTIEFNLPAEYYF
ncbi:MAG: WYL domain-containing protein [Ignavibacteria bacterium]